MFLLSDVFRVCLFFLSKLPCLVNKLLIDFIFLRRNSGQKWIMINNGWWCLWFDCISYKDPFQELWVVGNQPSMPLLPGPL